MQFIKRLHYFICPYLIRSVTKYVSINIDIQTCVYELIMTIERNQDSIQFIIN